MHPLVIAVLFAPPDYGRLGSDDWHTREAETQRLDNPFAPLALVPQSCPEVNQRIAYLRAKNLKWCNPWWQEQLAFRDDFPRWVRDFLATGKTRHNPRALYALFHEDAHTIKYKLIEVMLRILPDPCQNGHRESVWRAFYFSEFGLWEDYLHYHWHIAPAPREVER